MIRKQAKPSGEIECMLAFVKKLSLGFGGLLLIMLIAACKSIIQFRYLGKSIDVILKENYNSLLPVRI